MAQVVSVAVTIGGSNESRMTLVTNVLWLQVSVHCVKITGGTHRDPMPNMSISPTFCTTGTCSLMIMGIGRIRRMTSVPAFNPAVER